MRHRHLRTAAGSAGLAAVLLASVLSAPALAQSVTRITLNGSGATSSGGNVSISGSAVTITGPGTYEITGTLNNGYVRVDSPADGLVSLILNNASITNSTNSPLQIEDADEAEIVLAPGSTNQLTDGSNYVFPDPNEDEPNATLYSRADLTIGGTGSLNIRANYNDGINGKDDVIINSGTITIDAIDDGIRGKDRLTINGGNIDVRANGDGLKSDNKDAGRGIISITNGTVRVSAGDDAISAYHEVDISGGNVTVTESYEGIEAMRIRLRGGTVDVTARDDGINAVEDGLDEFAVAPNAWINISGGTVIVNSDVDGLDSNGTVTFSGGTTVINGHAGGMLGEGAIDANGAVYFNGGTVLAAGTSAMALLSTPPTTGQGWAVAQLPNTQGPNTVAHLVSNGQVLVSYRAPKNFREFVFSSDRIVNGQTYQVYVGGSISGTIVGGMSTSGSIAGATQVATVTAGQYSGGIGWPPPGGGWPPPGGGWPPPGGGWPPPGGGWPPPPSQPPPPPPSSQPPPPSQPPPGGSGGCTAIYTIVNQWPGGFQGEVQVTAGSSAINGWRVTWTFNEGQRIDNSWNATVTTNGSSVTASNVSHNGLLSPGASTSFGFLGTWNGANNAPSVSCTAS